MALYGGPYLVINAWLVLYTWLQHTDVDVPHFEDDEHNFVRGALHTIDRPYDKVNGGESRSDDLRCRIYGMLMYSLDDSSRSLHFHLRCRF